MALANCGITSARIPATAMRPPSRGQSQAEEPRFKGGGPAPGSVCSQWPHWEHALAVSDTLLPQLVQYMTDSGGPISVAAHLKDCVSNALPTGESRRSLHS